MLKHIPTVSSNFTAWVLLRKNKMCPIYDSKGKRKLFPECIVMITYYDNVGLQLLIEKSYNPFTLPWEICYMYMKMIKVYPNVGGETKRNTWYFS